MKHPVKMVAILLGMFLVTQFIGLYIVNHYNDNGNMLPYGMAPIDESQVNTSCVLNTFADLFSCTQYLQLMIFAFLIAVLLLLFLIKIKAEFILRAWFFIVVVISLGIFFYSFTQNFDFIWKQIPIITTLIAFLLAFFKIYKRNLLVHNITELLIYPGIAAVFVPVLNKISIIILLVIISGYDMWAVWKSKIMIKMAKYQIQKVKTFTGFFVPYLSKKVKLQIAKLSKSKLRKKKVRVNVAILGGGDVVFPIITAGVFLLSSGLMYALAVIFGAALGLLYLFLNSEKKKFYPAMPFITGGIFAGLLIVWIIDLLFLA